MKKYFYIGLWGIFIFEFFNIYFVMPYPGSQKINSLNLAYFLYSYRWIFRFVFGLLMLIGLKEVFSKRIFIPLIQLVFVGLVVYAFNFVYSAESNFRQPVHVAFKTKSGNKVNGKSLIIGIECNGVAKAYPILFMKYHHQFQDSVGGKPVMITYCNVCRSGIVFQPFVDGRLEKFRLVGMDHYNALFEDYSTKSWWRQSTGICVAGPLKGTELPVFPSQQMTLAEWLELHPASLIMQGDETFKSHYDTTLKFDYGKIHTGQIRTDSLSWRDKSWVVGIQIRNVSVAYDWNELKKKRIINDSIAGQKIILVLSQDQESFATYYRPDTAQFSIHHDTLFSEGIPYDFAGRDLLDTEKKLKPVTSKQEFWGSWKEFHPNTIKS